MRSLPKAPSPRNERGAAVILLLMLAVVAALIGIWGMTSTRHSLLRVGTYKKALDVQFEAERALKLTLNRIRLIAESTDAGSSKDDINTSDPKFLDWMINSICTPSTCSGVVDKSCPSDFDPNENHDAIEDSGNSNVVCNFMGSSFESTQVILVRKNDYDDGGELTAIFLVNVISKDSAGRRRLVQGVIAVPYQINTGVTPPFNLQRDSVYLVTSEKTSLE